MRVHHPIQKAIDDIWEAGHTPRIQVDARRDDVVVPESVKAKWGARLVLDLDSSWPLHLEYLETGIELDLAFQGHVTRCTLPWDAIYVVLDRATGRGVVIEPHMPRADADAPPIGGAGDEPGPREIAVPMRASAREAPSGPASTDEEAKRRRARFKVIDGGG